MTSYPKRINYVASVIESLYEQTFRPDQVHLWLSLDEFRLKEDELPRDLMSLVYKGQVLIHWLEWNTYLHKRHEIFNMTISEDLVFFFDDDTIYPLDLIENVYKKSNELDHKYIVNYNKMGSYQFEGRHIKYSRNYVHHEGYDFPLWCGHCMIPSSVYPKYVLTDEYVAKRNELSPISEESWLQPFIVWEGIPVTCLNYHFGKSVVPNERYNGLCSWYYKKDENGLHYKDRWLYAVLKEYPYIYDKYVKCFGYDK